MSGCLAEPLSGRRIARRSALFASGLAGRCQDLGADFADLSIAVDPAPQGFRQARRGLWIARRAFPDVEHPPAHFRELVGGASVAFDIALQLGRPEFSPRRRRLGVLAPLVRVPEAAMHEDRNSAAGHGDVGVPGRSRRCSRKR